MPAKEINILIIEDCMEDVYLIQEIFKRENLEKIHTQYANSLSFSLKLLEKSKFDLIILDLGLPDCVGFESIRKLRNNHPYIPIIILTGFDEELKEKALELGVQSYLNKGKTDAKTLIQTINSTVLVQQIMHELSQKTEYMLKVIFEDTPWMVALTTLENGKFLKTNKHFEENTGFPKEELIGRTVHETGIVIKPFDKTTLLQKMKEPGSVKNIRAVLRGKNGNTIKGVFSLCQVNYNNEECLLYVISEIIPPKQKKSKIGHTAGIDHSENSCCK